MKTSNAEAIMSDPNHIDGAPMMRATVTAEAGYVTLELQQREDGQRMSITLRPSDVYRLRGLLRDACEEVA